MSIGQLQTFLAHALILRITAQLGVMRYGQRGVARVRASDVRADRTALTERVLILAVQEAVELLFDDLPGRIREAGERRAIRPAADEPSCQPFATRAVWRRIRYRLAHLFDVVPERLHVLG